MTQPIPKTEVAPLSSTIDELLDTFSRVCQKAARAAIRYHVEGLQREIGFFEQDMQVLQRANEQAEALNRDHIVSIVALSEKLTAYESELAHLRESAITAEEAQEVLIDANYPVAVAPTRSLGERKKVRDAGLSKLRRLSVRHTSESPTP